MSSKLEPNVCYSIRVAPSGEGYGGNHSNGSLAMSAWRDSLVQVRLKQIQDGRRPPY